MLIPKKNPDGNIICPVCKGENPPDAIFCGAEGCHKAIGEFDYVAEEFTTSRSRLEKIADAVNDFTANPHFVTLHVAWFLLWILLNSGVLVFATRFDAYPFGLLGLLLGIEAIFITGFLLISQNRQNRYAEKRAELDYEVTVRSYRRLLELASSLEHIHERIARLEEKNS
jgi:uncharacterized membrane protein